MVALFGHEVRLHAARTPEGFDALAAGPFRAPGGVGAIVALGAGAELCDGRGAAAGPAEGAPRAFAAEPIALRLCVTSEAAG